MPDTRTHGRSQESQGAYRHRIKKTQCRVEERESSGSDNPNENLYLFNLSRVQDTIELHLNGFTLPLVIDTLSANDL